MKEHSSRDNRGNKSSKAASGIVARVKWMYTFFLAISFAILIKIFLIQAGSGGEELRRQGKHYSFDTTRVEAARGNLLSDDGRILTTSIPMYDLHIDFAAPKMHDTIYRKHIDALADSLSSMFGNKSANEYKHDLNQARSAVKRYFRIAPRKVNFLELQRVERFPLFNLGVATSGFIATVSYKRVRPYGNVASRTIGFVNSNGVKLGLEGSYDDILSGIDGLTIKQKISGNFWIPIQSDMNIEPVNGTDIQTTINIELQDIAQTALRDRIVEVDADWGTIIVMEVKTGHIKALANITRLENGQLVEDYNYAVGTSQEPGSTFKLPVLLALLDKGVSLNRIVDTEHGRVRIGSATIRDSHSAGYGSISVESVFAKSSNIGMAKLVNATYKNDETGFTNDLMRIGVNKELGLQIPGEPKPTFRTPKDRGRGWDGTTMSMMSFGYAVKLTPLQTLTIYNGLANDGKVMRPLLVSSLKEDGKIIREYSPEVLTEQLASPKAIKDAQRAMRAVVEYGTGKALKTDAYKIAVKTGTAQIAMGRRGYTAADGSRHYLGSVAGYFPADDPKYSVMIAFKTHYIPGSGKIYYGGSLASPLFKVVSDNIYNSSYEFITPYDADTRSNNNIKRRATTSKRDIAKSELDSLGMPNVRGMRLSEAQSILEDQGYIVRSKGIGFVKEQKLVKNSSGEQVMEISLEM